MRGGNGRRTVATDVPIRPRRYNASVVFNRILDPAPRTAMLTTTRLEAILDRLPRLTIGVVGDLFLDRYLDIDAALTEPSIETGLDAYQVARVRPSPGAAGTVINNLAALGVGRVHVISVAGNDGEGYELGQALDMLKAVDRSNVLIARDGGFRTPTYTKPMLQEAGKPARELNRLDIKNRRRLPGAAEEHVLRALDGAWPKVDALLVMDQVSEEDCGVITRRVRERLTALGQATPGKLILADSRERIGLFLGMAIKPNQAECEGASGGAGAEAGARELGRRGGRAVFCTRGERGILVVQPGNTAAHEVPAFPVRGPIDIVGAGDSTSAAIASAVAAGADFVEAAAFGNLVASITIQQLGTTGTASPAQVRARWREVTP
jgi:rfaE bifunctional protein kinase chain/domain